MHSLTGYPLLPFGVAPSHDAEPLPQRDLPLTDPQKRSLVMALMPLYECMNQARSQATKVRATLCSGQASDWLL